MSNSMFSKGLEAWALGQVNWNSDTIKVVAVDATDITINPATFDFLNDIPSGARVATATLTGKSAINGVLKAANALFAGVTGDQFENLVIYKEGGTEATSPLLIFFDTTAASSPITITPNSGDVTCVWNASGIATL